MDPIEKIVVTYKDYTCADGCCYEDWYECAIHLNNGSIIDGDRVNEYSMPMTERFTSEQDAHIWACKMVKKLYGYHLKCSSPLFESVSDPQEFSEPLSYDEDEPF